jgi:uncharacterized protein YprB with RNaseH-like and TPR domain
MVDLTPALCHNDAALSAKRPAAWGEYRRQGQPMRAYLDIETTFEQTISVIGIYRTDAGTVQLVGGGVNDLALYQALEGVTTLVTFNGASFDLPFIRRRLLVDLRHDFAHCDLLHICRRRGLRGGLKQVEATLGIARETAGISGWDAPRLWRRYELAGDRVALATLLAYNREDVVNLAELEAHLGLTERTAPCQVVRHIFC